MYGTIFRMKPKSGQGQSVIDIFDEWRVGRKPNAKGAVGGCLFMPDAGAGELIAVAIFEDEESYRSNGTDPEQDAWFRRLRDLLQDDPTWEDGEYVIGSFA